MSEKKKRYLVRQYNGGSDLVALFCIGSTQSDPLVIAAKPQIKYLAKYCTDMGVQTLVLEFDYVDRHFSEDYGGHYVKCYGIYTKKCTRLHYFTKKFTKANFTKFLLDEKALAKEGYLGFTVVKPLPETVVGRTCIIPRDANSGTFVRPENTPSLFGSKLEVFALPFQEQDHEVAACATSALWSSLQGTAHVFGHQILTPLQITRIAVDSSLPSDGLDITEMGSVVRSLGLETEVIDLTAATQELPSTFKLQAAIAAYLPFGIAPVLGIDFNVKDPSRKSELHAVTVSGIEYGNNPKPFRAFGVQPSNQFGEGFLLRASRIGKMYAHDDGVGPYSPITFTQTDGLVITSWTTDESGLEKKKEALLTDLLVPLYHQIRIPLLDILDVIVETDFLIEAVRRVPGRAPFSRIEWDVFLANNAWVKSTIHKAPLSATQKTNLLTRPLPHYIWRVRALVDGICKFELLFDATDLRQGSWLIEILYYDESLKRVLQDQLSKIHATRSDVTYSTTWKILNSLVDGAVRK